MNNEKNGVSDASGSLALLWEDEKKQHTILERVGGAWASCVTPQWIDRGG